MPAHVCLPVRVNRVYCGKWTGSSQENPHGRSLGDSKHLSAGGHLDRGQTQEVALAGFVLRSTTLGPLSSASGPAQRRIVFVPLTIRCGPFDIVQSPRINRQSSSPSLSFTACLTPTRGRTSGCS